MAYDGGSSHLEPHPCCILAVIAPNQFLKASDLILVVSFQLAQKYGPVFSLYIGGTLAVFIHGFPSAKEILMTKGVEFAGRPDYPINDSLLEKRGTNI